MKHCFEIKEKKLELKYVKQVENFYWKTDRLTDQKMNELEINLHHSNEDESDMETDSDNDA